MRTFACSCANTLYFDNTACVKCGAQIGMCPHCNAMVPLIQVKTDGWRCGDNCCGIALHRCANYVEHGCNRCSLADDSTRWPVCDYCAFTKVIPDLRVEGNREKWRRLERAKHRVLYILDLLALPFRHDTSGIAPLLSFEFKASTERPIHTGHANGCITINLIEADDVEREKTRVAFHEPQRTLVGHFRHELGHYFWDRLVKGQREEECRIVFGDERDPSYAVALVKYHADGPAPDWRTRFISEYATMHPWEDFAETFGAYLDIVTVLDTARNFEMVDCDLCDIDAMIVMYQQMGIAANEINRDMGLIDLVPEIFVPPVAEKIRFIHSLARSSLRTSPTVAESLIA